MERHPETTWQRYMRKFKEQPLIPLGVAATCVALGGAFYKQRSGDRLAMNRWLRFRVIAQGFTVAVAVIAGWEVAQQRKAARRVDAAGNDEAKSAQAEAEKKRFEARMKEAEEAHKVETGGTS